MFFYGGRRREYARKRLQENWRLEYAVILVLIELIAQGYEAILGNSRRFLHIQNTESD